MARLLLLIITFVTIGAVQGTEALECNRPNEEKRCVTKCSPEKTCRTKNMQVYCLHSLTEGCKNACVCKEGYYRNPGGACVSGEDCDRCSGRNTYYTCQTTPDQLCSDINQTEGNGEVSPVKDSPANEDDCAGAGAGNSTQCEAKCYCNPGTARDENDECVPYDQCNQPCGPDETKDYCPADCKSDKCPTKELKVSCPRPKICPNKPKCFCRFNTRRGADGTCISVRDCPPFKCEKPFEEYNPCPPICPSGYCSQATPDGRCPSLGRIGIILECNPQCRCKKDYWWNEQKVCVPYDQCPGKGAKTDDE